MKIFKSIKMLSILSVLVMFAACVNDNDLEFTISANGTVNCGDVKTVKTFTDNVATFEFVIENSSSETKNFTVKETREFDAAKFQTKVNEVAGDAQKEQTWDLGAVDSGKKQTVKLQLVIPADQKESVSCPVKLEVSDGKKTVTFSVNFEYTYTEPAVKGDFKISLTKDGKEIEDGAKLECSTFEDAFGKMEAVFDFTIENLTDEAYPYTLKEIRNFDNVKYPTSVCIGNCNPGNSEKEQTWEIGDLDVKPQTVQVHVTVPADEKEMLSLPVTLVVSNGVMTKTFEVTYLYSGKASFIVKNTLDNTIIKDGDVIELSGFEEEFGAFRCLFETSYTNNSESAKAFTIVEKRNFDSSKFTTELCLEQCMVGDGEAEQTWQGPEVAAGETFSGIQHHISVKNAAEKADGKIEFTYSDGENSLSFTVSYTYTPNAE